ncbi:metal/formaldehyde-sensitive transcriptional repressor [Catenovulum sp. 2E275]|uniref:metal/formaldehyde-sensitive transcriptional repressor n=1 Tax=Catenovulum sp. 2E275 TaxID=2980497 RepID=UPI0021D35D37|nr:metal/formaldehyde-sensitive transcriptional repressor [Catenovulum sp. 2E275]MCU4676522.1 metal/formaldehyde-sensitive transcriptional repressor [Catenovulum sp. 2E275]
MAHTIHNKKLLTRIRKIKGQAQGLEKMLTQESDETADCMKVLQQIAALKGAVNGLMMEVLEDHLREHLGVVELSEQQRAQELDQVINVLKTYVK